MASSTYKTPLSEASLISTSAIVTQSAAHLSVVEMALGSLAHSFHIPFTGHILSLNQGAFLCYSTKYSSHRKASAQACYEISGVAATFKSLAPTGKKLGPMLGIVVQGLLFSVGILIFGRRKFGQIMAFILLSVWAFIHPFVTLLISFGPKQLQQVATFYVEKMNLDYFLASSTVISVISVLFLTKVIVAIFIVEWVNQNDEKKWAQWQNHLIFMLQLRKYQILANDLKTRPNVDSPLIKSLHDLRSPLFLFSFLLTWIFLFVQKESWSSFILQSLRPVAFAFTLLYLARSNYLLSACGRAAEKFYFLRPVHHRLIKVHHYLSEQKN